MAACMRCGGTLLRSWSEVACLACGFRPDEQAANEARRAGLAAEPPRPPGRREVRPRTGGQLL